MATRLAQEFCTVLVEPFCDVLEPIEAVDFFLVFADELFECDHIG